MVDYEARGIPFGRAAEVNLRNNHAQYIFTWYVIIRFLYLFFKFTNQPNYRYGLAAATSVMLYLVMKKPTSNVVRRIRTSQQQREEEKNPNNKVKGGYPKKQRWFRHKSFKVLLHHHLRRHIHSSWPISVQSSSIPGEAHEADDAGQGKTKSNLILLVVACMIVSTTKKCIYRFRNPISLHLLKISSWLTFASM